MSMRNKLTGAALSLALIATFGIAGHAQQSDETGKAMPQNQFGGARKGGRGHHGMPVFRIMRELKLTDAQQEQARVIVERFKTGMEPQRQALKELHQQYEQGTISDDVKAKATILREEIRASMKGTQGELLAILTPEQRTQYDQLEQQWNTRREERRTRRGERKMHQAAPAQPPAQ